MKVDVDSQRRGRAASRMNVRIALRSVHFVDRPFVIFEWELNIAAAMLVGEDMLR